MPVKLYHFTTRDGARLIQEHGFGGGTCWLSPDVGSVSGDTGRSILLEVTLDLPEQEIERYAQRVTDDVWSDEAGDFVSDDSAQPYHWYEVPTNIVAAAGRVRQVTPEERRRLFADLDGDN